MKKTSASSLNKKPLPRLSTAAAILGIRGYQLFVSPILGPCCRFYPSCSEYALEAFDRHGLLKGVALASRRLLKCHPLHPGGFDPVP